MSVVNRWHANLRSLSVTTEEAVKLFGIYNYNGELGCSVLQTTSFLVKCNKRHFYCIAKFWWVVTRISFSRLTEFTYHWISHSKLKGLVWGAMKNSSYKWRLLHFAAKLLKWLYVHENWRYSAARVKINLYLSMSSLLERCFCLPLGDANDIRLLGMLDKLADIDPVTKTIKFLKLYKRKFKQQIFNLSKIAKIDWKTVYVLS